MNVPFVDLKAQYQSIKAEMDLAIQGVIDNTAFISGQHAKAFEAGFAQYVRRDHVIACANGTDSLEILLQAMGVGPGDEVIVPALTWISTGEAVTAVGATPVFVDIDDYFTIDADQIESKLTAQTKAIIPVHLYGQPCDMPRIMEIAQKHGLKVLEDCAQAHGAELNGQRIATFGNCGSFSFYPGKNLGAYGDAGGMVTNDADLARTARMIANHGQEGKHNHIMEGRNSRMDGIQAAVLNVKLPRIENWTDLRIANAGYYQANLQGPVTKPRVRPGARHVYHLYVVQSDSRDGLKSHLESNGIGCAIHYPAPLPHMACYSRLGHQPGDFPMAEKACDTILSIPMFPELTQAQMDRVIEVIQNFEG